VKERDDGIVLKGAQQLATGAAFADAVYISCIHPLSPGDEAYAFGVAVPANAPAEDLHAPILCRRGATAPSITALVALR